MHEEAPGLKYLLMEKRKRSTYGLAFHYFQIIACATGEQAAQVGWFKFTKKRYGAGRRILTMAPLHHHFEKSGWKETQVVVRFWIVTMLLCLVGLASLKIR